MKAFLDYLETWTKKEKVVQKAAKTMKEGDVWFYPVILTEGVEYSFKVRGCKHAGVACTLTNGDPTAPLRKANGSKFSFSFAPDKTGVYGLTLSRSKMEHSADAGKVTVTIGQEYTPASYANRLFK